MSYILYCALCGLKAVSGTSNKACRALCPKHLGMAQSMDRRIEERIADMTVDVPSYLKSEVTRVR